MTLAQRELFYGYVEFTQALKVLGYKVGLVRFNGRWDIRVWGGPSGRVIPI